MKRRRAREYALQFLYRIDFLSVPEGEGDTPILPDLQGDLLDFWANTEEQDPEVKAFAEDLISGTIRHLKELDVLLQKVAEKWKVLRMASVDRTIMRFSAYEVLFRKDIPNAVTINEALEIAKKYSTAESASFINGILDKIAKDYADEEESGDTAHV